jgi:hypothetical protein
MGPFRQKLEIENRKKKSKRKKARRAENRREG